MDKWTYTVVTFDLDTTRGDWVGRWKESKSDMSHRGGTVSDILNFLGESGWELVGYGTPQGMNTATFKRRKP